MHRKQRHRFTHARIYTHTSHTQHTRSTVVDARIEFISTRYYAYVPYCSAVRGKEKEHDAVARIV